MTKYKKLHNAVTNLVTSWKNEQKSLNELSIEKMICPEGLTEQQYNDKVENAKRHREVANDVLSDFIVRTDNLLLGFKDESK